MTFPLELILVYVLLFQDGISGRDVVVYHRRGQEAILLCGEAFPPDITCPYITWLYTTSSNTVFPVVKNKKVRSNSPQAARLSMDRECSLVIQSVTAEDVGVYTCRRRINVRQDERSILNVLTISPAPPDAGPKSDGEVTLKCSLRMYTDAVPCRQSSIRWLDETGSVLRGEGVGDSFLQETDCVSVLKVKHQSGHSNRYTCQFVDENQVKTEADYTLDFTGGKTETSDPEPPSDHTYIAIGAVVGAVVVLVAIAAVLIKYRKRVTEDVQTPTQHPDEPESSLTYVTVSHAHHQAAPYKKVREEVTYSTVNTVVKMEADGSVSKPKIHQRK